MDQDSYPAARLPYRLRPGLLGVEASLYRALVDAVGGRALIVPRVRLDDLLQVPANTAHGHHFRSLLTRLEIDFVLADPATAQILVAIMVDADDQTTGEGDERGAFLDEALAAAGLPLVRLAAKRGYGQAELVDQLDGHVQGIRERTVQVVVALAAVSTPACPLCGAAMVLRRKLHGPHHGQQFWGCSNYSRTQCRGIRPALVHA